MTYQLTKEGSIRIPLDGDVVMFLPPQGNGTPEWAAYKAWLSEGNTPLPAPEPEPPPELTPEQKLAASGLSVEDLRQLLGLDP